MSGQLFLFPLKQNASQINIYRIIDGDTLEVSLDRGFRETKVVYLRLANLNAPETRTKRVLEKQAGWLVKQIITQWATEREKIQFYATSDEKPKYANRIVGRLWAETEEDCLNSFLLELKVVKPYTGGKREFTDEELQEIITNCNSFLEKLS